jgi:hypothetical protein
MESGAEQPTDALTMQQRLQTFGDGSLAYETSMLYETTAELVRRLVRSSEATDTFVSDETSMRNALLESLLIHARVLQEFLNRKSSQHADDVLAVQFVPDWNDDLRVVVGDIVTRMHKQLAHLSLARERKRPWPVIQIADDILSEMRRFSEAAWDHGYGLAEVDMALDEWTCWKETERDAIETVLELTLEDLYYGS